MKIPVERELSLKLFRKSSLPSEMSLSSVVSLFRLEVCFGVFLCLEVSSRQLVVLRVDEHGRSEGWNVPTVLKIRQHTGNSSLLTLP